MITSGVRRVAGLCWIDIKFSFPPNTNSLQFSACTVLGLVGFYKRSWMTIKKKKKKSSFENGASWTEQPKTLDMWKSIHAMLTSPSSVTMPMTDSICVMHLFLVCGLFPRVCRRGRQPLPWGSCEHCLWKQASPGCNDEQARHSGEVREEREQASKASLGWRGCASYQWQAAGLTAAQEVVELTWSQGSPEAWEQWQSCLQIFLLLRCLHWLLRAYTA